MYKIIHTVVVLLIISGLFYWFQWRPSEIRKECSKNFTQGYLSSRLSISPSEKYQKCLHEKGL